jgi:hypothetical protein
MAGLAVAGALNSVITPITSGKVIVTLTGAVFNNTAAGLVNLVQIRFGTGSPPANGAAATGTAIGGIASRGAATTTTGFVPLSLTALLTGLAIGVPVWLDVIFSAAGGGSVILQNVAFTAVETP